MNSFGWRITLTRLIWGVLAAGLVVLGLISSSALVSGGWLVQEWKSGKMWPKPPVINLGETDDAPPSDAIVLFDGQSLQAWDGGDRWRIEDGVAVVQRSSIRTKQEFGDCQLHLEYAAPERPRGRGQGRGNSGIKFFERYEIQILDSYQNDTYPDGQCGALYKQQPPLVNACRKPGRWQSFDIIFIAPRFDNKQLVQPGYVTVFHNGVVIHNHVEMQGETAWHKPPEYIPHGPKGRLLLQNHGDPVKFRNIWIRELQPPVEPQIKK